MNAYGESCAGSERSMKRYVGHCDWWRPMLAAGVIPNMIAVMLVMFNVPESPRFLLYQNKMDGVRQFVKRVAETNGAMDKVLKGGAVRELDGAETQGVTMTQQMHEILSPSMRRIMLFILVVWSLFALAVFGQSFAYPVLLERDADLSFHDQYVLLIQVAAVEIPGIAMVIWTMESPSIGRKYSVIMFAGLIPVAAVAAVISEQYGLVWFHVANILLRMFSILPYEVMYVYAAELLPTSHRNLGVSIGNGTTKLVAVAVPIALMPLLADWSGWVYVIIAAAGLLATLLLVFLGVEPSDHLPDSVLEVAEGQSTDRADFDSERRYLLDHNQRQKEEKGSV
ncbi:major facilitator superfamily domain-containing protein [Baffinella frigidus]|nr:major facilitator superfamily domain-containing protein [Cryptophyta sp. CCMP2293]